VTAYQYSSVNNPTTCASVSENRTCTNGVLSGSYTKQACAVKYGCYTPSVPIAGTDFNNCVTIDANTGAVTRTHSINGPDPASHCSLMRCIIIKQTGTLPGLSHNDADCFDNTNIIPGNVQLKVTQLYNVDTYDGTVGDGSIGGGCFNAPIASWDVTTKYKVVGGNSTLQLLFGGPTAAYEMNYVSGAVRDGLYKVEFLNYPNNPAPVYIRNLFGDYGVCNGQVSAAEETSMDGSYGAASGQAQFRSYMDYDRNNMVAASDRTQAARRKSWTNLGCTLPAM
jgi:hypothetical protein